MDMIKQEGRFRRKNETTVIREFHEIIELSNQEVYDSWAKLKIQQQQIAMQVSQTEQSLELLKQKQNLLDIQVQEMDEIAKDCEKHIPSRVEEGKKVKGGTKK